MKHWKKGGTDDFPQWNMDLDGKGWRVSVNPGTALARGVAFVRIYIPFMYPALRILKEQGESGGKINKALL